MVQQPGPPVDGLRVDPRTLTLPVGGRGTLTAIITDGSGAPVSNAITNWASRNPLVANVDKTGNVTGIIVGQTMVVAAAGGKSDSALVTVLDDLVLELSPPAASVQVGQSAAFTVIARNGAGQIIATPALTWRSSVPAIATISAAGIATGVARGVTLITATARSVTSNAAQLSVDEASPCDGIALQLTFNGTIDYVYSVRERTRSGSDLVDGAYNGHLIATMTRQPWVPGIPTVLWTGVITGDAHHRETQTDPQGNVDFRYEGNGAMVPLAGQPPRMSMIVDLPTCTHWLTANATLNLTVTEFGSSTNRDALTAQFQSGKDTPLGQWRNGIAPSRDPFLGHSIIWAGSNITKNAFMPLGLAVVLFEQSAQEPPVGVVTSLQWTVVRP